MIEIEKAVYPVQSVVGKSPRKFSKRDPNVTQLLIDRS